MRGDVYLGAEAALYAGVREAIPGMLRIALEGGLEDGKVLFRSLLEQGRADGLSGEEMWAVIAVASLHCMAETIELVAAGQEVSSAEILQWMAVEAQIGADSG